MRSTVPFPPAPRHRRRPRARPAGRRHPQLASSGQIVRLMRLVGRRLGRRAALVPAMTLLGLTLVLAVGCSAASENGNTSSGGTGRVAPRLTITPPPTHAPIQLPTGGGQPATGAPAIKPHLDGVPAFTADDMAAYVKSHPLPNNFGKDGSPTIVQNAFLPGDAISQLLNMPGGVLGQSRSISGAAARQAEKPAQNVPIGALDSKLFGFIMLQGNFIFPPATPTSPPPTSPYAYEVFDAQSGNLLLYGGLAQPPSAQPTATPLPTATPTRRPTPTNTPAPSCTPLTSGTGAMNVDNTYLDVESATGIGHQPTGADAQWSPAAGTMQPVGGALLADQGNIGANGFTNLTCAQIKGASYGGGSVSVADGEVFLVKTAAGRYAKVLISLTPGNPNPALRWQTYS